MAENKNSHEGRYGTDPDHDSLCSPRRQTIGKFYSQILGLLYGTFGFLQLL